MLCVYPSRSAGYLRSQLKTFSAGLSSPDFPGGPGEVGFTGRVTPEDVVGAEARKVFGLEEWTLEDVQGSKGEAASAGEIAALATGNMIIF